MPEGRFFHAPCISPQSPIFFPEIIWSNAFSRRALKIFLLVSALGPAILAAVVWAVH